MYSAKVIANVIEEFKWVFLLLQLMENYEFSLNCRMCGIRQSRDFKSKRYYLACSVS